MTNMDVWQLEVLEKALGWQGLQRTRFVGPEVLKLLRKIILMMPSHWDHSMLLIMG